MHGKGPHQRNWGGKKIVYPGLRHNLEGEPRNSDFCPGVINHSTPPSKNRGASQSSWKTASCLHGPPKCWNTVLWCGLGPRCCLISINWKIILAARRTLVRSTASPQRLLGIPHKRTGASWAILKNVFVQTCLVNMQNRSLSCFYNPTSLYYHHS